MDMRQFRLLLPAIFLLLFLLGLLMLAMIHSCSAEMNDIDIFLLEDTTDRHEYLPWYTCGHFSRDLVSNASEQNITLGSMILGNHPVFRGHDNHIVNYIDNGSIYIIEPQTDEIYPLNQSMYTYYRLYTDGTQVPTYWRYNLAHSGTIVTEASYKGDEIYDRNH